MTVCPSYSGHFQGKDVGVEFAELGEILNELLDELLDEELLVVDAD